MGEMLTMPRFAIFCIPMGDLMMGWNCSDLLKRCILKKKHVQACMLLWVVLGSLLTPMLQLCYRTTSGQLLIGSGFLTSVLASVTAHLQVLHGSTARRRAVSAHQYKVFKPRATGS